VLASGAMHQTLPASAARRLLLQSTGLTGDPARKATPAAVAKLIEQMGFVQVDTINVVERAHQHILFTRLDGYGPAMLTKLLERDRRLFEHWSHDASLVPTAWFPYWTGRFERFRTDWRIKRRLSRLDDANGLLRHVRERIEREGPLMSRDFEHPEKRTTSWWGWKPQKVALETLWQTGELAITRREGFQKVYDLIERTLPRALAEPVPDPDALLDFVCRQTLAHIGAGTPGKIAGLYDIASAADVKRWCEQALARGEVCEVLLESAGDAPARKLFALSDWESRARRAKEPPERIRLLNPFDPLIHDRERTLRVFGFDYAFEGFVPPAKRRYGYYVMPLLEGDRFVGRVDPKFHRDRGELEIRGLWWEDGIRPTRARRRAFEAAVDGFAGQLGAEHWTLSRKARARA